jgi:hypothetical protein
VRDGVEELRRQVPGRPGEWTAERRVGADGREHGRDLVAVAVQHPPHVLLGDLVLDGEPRRPVRHRAPARRTHQR